MLPSMAGTGTCGVTCTTAAAEPARGKLKVCAPAVQVSELLNEPATALLNETVVDAEPVPGTGKLSGATVNSGAAGAVQVTVTGPAFGFWNAIGAVVAGPPRVCAGVVTVEPLAGVEVSGVCAHASPKLWEIVGGSR